MDDSGGRPSARPDDGRTRDELVGELEALRARLADFETRSKLVVHYDALTTVSTPPELEPLFLKAQEYVARYFRDGVQDPSHATITFSGERYVLVRAASMSVEFFELVTSLYTSSGAAEARAVANNLLFDLAHSIGKADARDFSVRLGLVDPIERLSAGPVHFSFAGWAFVKILPESSPSPDDDYMLVYDHLFSFESDAWLRRGGKSEFPVCIMNSGYSSGWCEESFGLPLVAAEVQCLAKGDAQCRFVMAPPGRIEEHLERYVRTLDAATPRHVPAPVVSVPEYFQRRRMEEALRASHAELEHRVLERTEELARANVALHAEIAERKREEEERQRLERQVLHAQKLESLGVLAGGIAHDFNNLLVGILGNAALALTKLGPDDPLRRALEGIQSSGLRAADLTKQMLAYSGRGKFVVQPVNLSAIVEEMVHLLRASISKRAICEFDLALAMRPVEADATQIRQIAMNLITNASEALAESHGRITLRTGVMDVDREFLAATHFGDELPEGSYAFMEVADTGCGMDDETRARIFDPFFTTKFMGRGLGLAAVLGIVRGHGGAIRVASEVGKGTSFLVLFPLSQADEAVLEIIAPPTPEAWRGRGTVLVVDDEPLVRDMTSDLLAELGFEAVRAENGADAVSIVATYGDELSVVLLDLMMPKMGGEEALGAIRSLRPEIPVILMSGFSEQEVMGQFAGRGLVGFLQKPFLLSDLSAILRRATEARGSSS